MQIRIIDLFRELKKNGRKLFYGNLLQNVDCMKDYETNTGVSQIDKIIVRKYGDRVFETLEEEVTIPELLGEWEDVVEGYILSNQYNLDKIWEMLHEEYKPLYNYDKHSNIETSHKGDILVKTGNETNTETKSGSETNTTTKSGSETNTTTKSGSETNTTTKSGSETNTTTKSGSETNTTTHGELDKTITNNNIPWDVVAEKEVNNVNEHTDGRNDTDVLTFANRQDADVLTFTNRQDADVLTFTNRKDENVTTFANRKDENVLTFANRKDSIDYTDKTIEETFGNIGTTTSSDLMIKEYDARWKVNFYMELFARIILELTW